MFVPLTGARRILSAATKYPQLDEFQRNLSVLLLLCAIATWVWCVVLTHLQDTMLLLGFPRPVVIGSLCYFSAIVASEFREAL